VIKGISSIFIFSFCATMSSKRLYPTFSEKVKDFQIISKSRQRSIQQMDMLVLKFRDTTIKQEDFDKLDEIVRKHRSGEEPFEENYIASEFPPSEWNYMLKRGLVVDESKLV